MSVTNKGSVRPAESNAVAKTAQESSWPAGFNAVLPGLSSLFQKLLGRNPDYGNDLRKAATEGQRKTPDLSSPTAQFAWASLSDGVHKLKSTTPQEQADI